MLLILKNIYFNNGPMVILKRSFNTQTISQFQWSALFFGHNIAFLAFKFALISWCFLFIFSTSADRRRNELQI